MSYIWQNALFLLLGTAIGSFLLIFWKKPFDYNTSLAFSGGVMLVASFMSLIIPGIESGGFFITTLGILLGFALLGLVENLFPHEHILKGYEGKISFGKSKRLLLIAFGIFIHNIPEGLSVGVATAYSDKVGRDLAIAISLQDVPEGLVVSLPLYLMTGSIFIPILIGLLSGLLESAFAVLGYFTIEVFKGLLSFALGFGGGAMLYVTIKEVFPEVYAEGVSHIRATVGFLLGFVVMLFLDTL